MLINPSLSRCTLHVRAGCISFHCSLHTVRIFVTVARNNYRHTIRTCKGAWDISSTVVTHVSRKRKTESLWSLWVSHLDITFLGEGRHYESSMHAWLYYFRTQPWLHWRRARYLYWFSYSGRGMSMATSRDRTHTQGWSFSDAVDCFVSIWWKDVEASHFARLALGGCSLNVANNVLSTSSAPLRKWMWMLGLVRRDQRRLTVVRIKWHRLQLGAIGLSHVLCARIQ